MKTPEQKQSTLKSTSGVISGLTLIGIALIAPLHFDGNNLACLIVSMITITLAIFNFGLIIARKMLLVGFLMLALTSQAQIEVGQVWETKSGLECKIESRISDWATSKLSYKEISSWVNDGELTNNWKKVWPEPEPMIKVGDYWQDGSGGLNKVLVHLDTVAITKFSTSTHPFGWWFLDSDFTNEWKRIEWNSSVNTNQPILFVLGNSSTNGAGIGWTTNKSGEANFKPENNLVSVFNEASTSIIDIQFKGPCQHQAPTNVILYPPFTGTIQVGTNFYRINDKTRTYTEKVLEKVGNLIYE